MPTKRETTGWLFALSDNADSDWGSIDRFYESFMADASSEVFVVESEVWGKTLRKGMRLAAGDGIAFYHTRRAGFPPRDPFGRRPRISLIGTIVDVEQEGQNVTFLSVEVRADDLRALKTRPFVRTEQTERLFRKSGMVPGAVASFYRIPADVWSKITAASRADTKPLRGHVPEVGFSTLAPPPRRSTIVLRIIRDTQVARELKERYGYHCQLCGTRVQIRPGVYYAEVHHVQPLGSPHNGPDTEDNMLVLCPNHHAAFDLGGALFLSPNHVMISGQRFNIKTKHALSDAVTDYNNSIAVR